MSYKQFLVEVKIKAEDKVVCDWYFAQSKEDIDKLWNTDKFEIIKCEHRPTYVVTNNGGFYNMKDVELGIPFNKHLDQALKDEDKLRGGI